MTRGFIYCRQSITRIGSLSLKTQEKTCREFCKKKNFKIAKIVKFSNKSARNMKNNKSLFSLTDKMKKDDILIIYRVDRLSRNFKLGLEVLNILKEKGIIIHSVDEKINYSKNPIKFKKLLKKAEEFSDNMSNIQKKKINYLKQKGCHFGKPKYGYRSYRTFNNIRKIQIDLEEQKIIKYIIQNIQNNVSCIELSNELNNRQILCKNKYWTPQKVKYIYKTNFNNFINITKN